MTEPKLSLHRKLATVMYEAERIPKNGTAPAVMGGYKFVQVGDAADYIRKALAEKVISMMPTEIEVLDKTEHATKNGGSMTTVDLRVTWTLTDGESGETAIIQSYGAGADGGDKYSGKASTSAMKYALLSGFLLSTGEDTELTDTSGRTAASTEPAGANRETLTPLGMKRVTGEVVKGGEAHQGKWRAGIDGPAIGFKLKLDGDDRDIPQVNVHGDIGRGLSLLVGEDPLIGLRVTVKGTLYNVRPARGNSFYRLVAEHAEHDFIEGLFGRVPASPELLEAGLVPAFSADELADLDSDLALALMPEDVGAK